MGTTASELKNIYAALATKEAKIIQYDNDIAALKRITINNMRILKDLGERRDNTMKEIKGLQAGLELILEANR